MNYIELQRMRKAAGLGWGWVNDLVGDDNFVSDIFGKDRYDRLNNQANQVRQQMNEDLGPEAIQRQQQGAADWDRRVAEVGHHLDYRLAAAQQAAEKQRQQEIAQQQAAASKRNENLMAAYMTGNNQQLDQQNQVAANGNAMTNQQLEDRIGNAKRRVAAYDQKYRELYGTDHPAYASAQGTAQPAAAPAQAAVVQQPQRNYQAFNRNNLSGYTQDQINAINAAAQKKGLKMGDITQVSFNDKGAVNGFRVRRGTLNQQPQQPVAAKPNALIASTPTENVYDARKS